MRNFGEVLRPNVDGARWEKNRARIEKAESEPLEHVKVRLGVDSAGLSPDKRARAVELLGKPFGSQGPTAAGCSALRFSRGSTPLHPLARSHRRRSASTRRSVVKPLDGAGIAARLGAARAALVELGAERVERATEERAADRRQVQCVSCRS